MRETRKKRRGREAKGEGGEGREQGVNNESRNIPEFHSAFMIPQDTPMHISAERQVDIW